jgi:hypothetical protein
MRELVDDKLGELSLLIYSVYPKNMLLIWSQLALKLIQGLIKIPRHVYKFTVDLDVPPVFGRTPGIRQRVEVWLVFQ